MINIKVLIVAGVVAVAGLPAFAVTSVSTDKIQPTYTGMLGAPTAISGEFRQNLQGTISGSRTPWEDFAGLADSAYYNSVQANSHADYTFATAQTEFSLMWGSPDDYNTLSFFDAGDNLVFTIDGDDTAITSTPGYVNRRSFVNVHISGIEDFTTVRFISGSNAFEFSNVAAVPLPAALPLMIAGLGAVGGLRLRKKRAS